MIYLIPTKRGLGVEFWGTHDDLSNFYAVIGKFWNDEAHALDDGYSSRDQVISSFSYEIRKAKEGSRMVRDSSHFSTTAVQYAGSKISWVHFLFALTSIKQNMRYHPATKFDISQILNIEYWLERAMNSFDKVGGSRLENYIDDGLYGGNKNIYQFMRAINAEYFMMKGGKAAFRKLPLLLRRGVYGTEEFQVYETFLTGEASRLGCRVNELELSDDDVNYDDTIW